MAIYRCEFKIYSRGRAHSAVAGAAYVTGTKQTKRGGNFGGVKLVSAVEAAAYRANDRLQDDHQDRTFDYGNKKDVIASFILAPDHAPAWARDRAKLWNTVEAKEDTSTRPQTAQLFREALLTIPRGLTREQQIALVRAYVQDQFVSQGMVVDVGIHAPKASDLAENVHAHCMMTLRDIGPEGFGKKRRDWNDVQWQGKGANTARQDGFLQKRRAAWEDYCNAALEEAGSTARVDRRSLKDRGIARDPQPKLGKAHYAKPAPWVANVHDNHAAARFGNRSRNLARGVAQAKRPRPASDIPFALPLGGAIDAQTRRLARSVLTVERTRGHRYARDGVAHAEQTARWLRGERLDPEAAPTRDGFDHDR